MSKILLEPEFQTGHVWNKGRTTELYDVWKGCGIVPYRFITYLLSFSHSLSLILIHVLLLDLGLCNSSLKVQFAQTNMNRNLYNQYFVKLKMIKFKVILKKLLWSFSSSAHTKNIIKYTHRQITVKNQRGKKGNYVFYHLNNVSHCRKPQTDDRKAISQLCGPFAAVDSPSYPLVTICCYHQSLADISQDCLFQIHCRRRGWRSDLFFHTQWVQFP